MRRVDDPEMGPCDRGPSCPLEEIEKIWKGLERFIDASRDLRIPKYARWKLPGRNALISVMQ